MVYLYYESKDSTFLLWEMRTNPPYEACITAEKAREDENSFWSKYLFTRNEALDVDIAFDPDTNLNWSDEYPSISLLLTFKIGRAHV